AAIAGGDLAVQLTFARLAGDEGPVVVAVGGGALLGVEAEVGLALVLVGAVAGEAVVGEDRADVPVEGHVGGAGGRGEPTDQAGEDHERPRPSSHESVS